MKEKEKIKKLFEKIVLYDDFIFVETVSLSKVLKKRPKFIHCLIFQKEKKFFFTFLIVLSNKKFGNCRKIRLFKVILYPD